MGPHLEGLYHKVIQGNNQSVHMISTTDLAIS